MCCTRPAKNTGRKKSYKIRHLGTITQVCRAVFLQIRHISTIRKKITLNINNSSIYPHNMANFGPLTAEIGSGVWGIPANFNGYRVLISLLHGTLVVGVSQTLRRWIQGATYIRQGRHHVGHWPTSCYLVVHIQTSSISLVVRALNSRLGGREFDSRSPPSTGMSDSLRLGKPHQYFSMPLRPTQSPALSGTGNAYQPQCGDALRLRSKGSYCSFHLWTRWLYCMECPQYRIRLEALGYLCDCLSGRVQDNNWSK